MIKFKYKIILFVLITSLIKSEVLLADGMRLSTRYDQAAAQLGISFKNDADQRSCLVKVYAQKSAEALRRGKGQKILAFKASKKKLSYLTADTAFNSFKERKIYIRAEADCNGIKRFSNIASFKIGSAQATNQDLLQILIAIRQSYLRTFFTFEDYFVGRQFQQPVDLAMSSKKDKEFFVVQQTGLIKKVSLRLNTESVVLDIRDRLLVGGERGLLGLALHPDFARNNLYFVNYTRAGDGATVISRFDAEQGAQSEKILLTVAQPYSNHNGGGLAFGPDSYLYIALGDGGSGGDPLGNAQNLTTHLGKILRINVNRTDTYSVPSTNPFANGAAGIKPEIWAYGLRNPWRISFDKQSGNLWTADVGQSQLEEINIIKKARNYGWNITEGSQCYQQQNCDFSKLTLPVHEYGRSLGASVTGGFVYRGKNNPNFEGLYFFADFISGRIFGLEKSSGSWVATELINTDYNIASFGQDRDGELYFSSYSDGKIFKIGEKR